MAAAKSNLFTSSTLYGWSQESSYIIASKFFDIINARVSSHFKKALFWPEFIQKKCKTSVTPKEKVPSVATSSEWQKYY